MKINFQKRLRNKAFWVTLASFVGLIIQHSGYGIDMGKYNELVEGLLSLFTVAGIFNNPDTENTGFSDD